MCETYSMMVGFLWGCDNEGGMMVCDNENETEHNETGRFCDAQQHSIGSHWV